ncbi:hypothetical protein ATANTOWER_019037, partial [Ataeniobius toweri]|nr:hypothetical protein [Ataeniobius toweri]
NQGNREHLSPLLQVPRHLGAKHSKNTKQTDKAQILTAFPGQRDFKPSACCEQLERRVEGKRMSFCDQGGLPDHRAVVQFGRYLKDSTCFTWWS